MRFTVRAGEHDRKLCPVKFTVPASEVAGLQNPAIVFDGGDALPAQISVCGDEAVVAFILDELKKGEEVNFAVAEAPVNTKAVPSLKVELTEKTVDVISNGKKYNHYYFGTDLAKPYFGPWFDRYGSQITRLDFEIKEHPHHRSLWFSHGNVNGVDNWNESPNHGYIRTQSIDGIENGPAYVRFTAHNLWTEHDESKNICTEHNTITMYNVGDGIRMLDVELVIRADYCDVTLGSTKEAGPIAIRVNDTLTVKNGGYFKTGIGTAKEAEVWMHRAPWCDYYGTKDGHVCGAAIFDNEENEHYPTHWHARDYGLFAPNNFFKMGDSVIKQGESKTFKYRVLFHSGNTEDADVSGHYLNYISMPVVTPENVEDESKKTLSGAETDAKFKK